MLNSQLKTIFLMLHFSLTQLHRKIEGEGERYRGGDGCKSQGRWVGGGGKGSILEKDG